MALRRTDPAPSEAPNLPGESVWSKIDRIFSKLLPVMLLAGLVIRGQLPRPRVARYYHTNDFDETRRAGADCACAVLPSRQSSTDDDWQWTRNRCHEQQLLENVHILVYSNFTGVEDLETNLRGAFSHKRSSSIVVDGFQGLLTDKDKESPSFYLRYEEEMYDIREGYRASFLYTNFSRVKSGPIRLGFWELDTRLEAWNQLKRLYPSIYNNCFALPMERVYEGTSICSAAMRAPGWDMDQLDGDQFDGENEDWFKALCPNGNTRDVPRHLVLWDTLEETQEILTWPFVISATRPQLTGQRANLCSKTYNFVLRQEILGENGSFTTVYWEMKCPRNADPPRHNYCWKTGRYHNMTDPSLAGNTWNAVDGFENPKDFFLCYEVKEQSWSRWFSRTVAMLVLCLIIFDYTSCFIYARPSTLRSCLEWLVEIKWREIIRRD